MDLPTSTAPASTARLVDDADHRTRHFRRFKQLVAQIAEQVGEPESLTPVQATTIRNAAAMQLRAEQLAGALVRGETVDGCELARLVSISGRLISTLKRGRMVSAIAA
jgi:hypothetical protein